MIRFQQRLGREKPCRTLSFLRFGSVPVVAALLALAGTAHAQITTIDPNRAIDGDLDRPQNSQNGQLPPVSGDPYADPYAAPAAPSEYVYPDEQTPSWDTKNYPDPYNDGAAPAVPAPQPNQPVPGQPAPPVQGASAATYQRDDVLGAAERAFGSGAEGLAKLIEEILSKQGEPNAYITGREAGGAFVAGLRYGEGTMYHKVEGELPVFWTGPSIGFDAGANASSTFILVYNLWDSDDLYERYPAGEGQAYVVGGFNASYVRKGDVVLIPIRMGVGVRLGINAGYLRFSRKHRWFPF